MPWPETPLPRYLFLGSFALSPMTLFFLRNLPMKREEGHVMNCTRCQGLMTEDHF